MPSTPTASQRWTIRQESAREGATSARCRFLFPRSAAVFVFFTALAGRAIAFQDALTRAGHHRNNGVQVFQYAIVARTCRPSLANVRGTATGQARRTCSLPEQFDGYSPNDLCPTHFYAASSISTSTAPDTCTHRVVFGFHGWPRRVGATRRPNQVRIRARPGRGEARPRIYFLENIRENNPGVFGSASWPLHRLDAGTPLIT